MNESRPDIAWLDEEIERLDRWIPWAAKSIVRFSSDDGTYFDRKRDGDSNGESTHPTTTARCYKALAEYLRYIEEEGNVLDDRYLDRYTDVFTDDPNNDGSASDHTKELLRSVGNDIVANFDDRRGGGSEDLNNFTDAHFVQMASFAAYLNDPPTTDSIVELDANNDAIREKIKPVMDGLSADLADGGIGVTEDDPVHDFVTLHALRGVDWAATVFDDVSPVKSTTLDPLRKKTNQRCLESVAFETSGLDGKYDPNELCFSLSLLNRLGGPDTSKITEQGLETIEAAQRGAGGWPTPRYVSYRSRMQVASYEVALTLSELFQRFVSATGETPSIGVDSVGLQETFTGMLSNSFSLVRERFRRETGVSGWANDHAWRSYEPEEESGREAELIESWVGAVVLQFLIRYRDALTQLRQQQVLADYDANFENAAKIGTDANWPYQLPWLRAMRITKNTDAIKYISDPTDNGEFRDAIEAQMVDPILDDWLHRPQNVSLILHGEPGTRKTTATKMVAKAVGWPFLVLTPSDFLKRRGLEGFEESAAEIFDDLSRLSRVVVLFDECEDFFRSRPDETEVESRTLGAFITAGMLPKLEGLHERGSIVYALATNEKIENLDNAAIRSGRFDFQYNLSYPSLVAQTNYVDNQLDALLDETQQKHLIDILEETDKLGDLSDNDDESTEVDVGFNDIHELIDWIEWSSLDTEDGLETNEAARKLTMIAKRPGPPNLVEQNDL